uniref:Secreted protein n=1 Tax=Steinernema glaseri TaxID=37863 RepID=A0A1I7ZJQ1_9BILA
MAGTRNAVLLFAGVVMLITVYVHLEERHCLADLPALIKLSFHFYIMSNSQRDDMAIVQLNHHRPKFQSEFSPR